MHPGRHDMMCRLGIGLQYWDAYLLWKSEMKFMAKSFVDQIGYQVHGQVVCLPILHEGRSGRGDLKDIFVEVYHFGCKRNVPSFHCTGMASKKFFFCFAVIFM